MSTARPLCSRWVGKAVRTERGASNLDVPIFLCPAIRSSHRPSTKRPLAPTFCQKRPGSLVTKRRLHTAPVELSTYTQTPTQTSSVTPPKTLPEQCHGCGAFSQTTNPDVPGYYDKGRQAVKRYLGLEQNKPIRQDYKAVQDVLENIDQQQLSESGLNLETLTAYANPRAARQSSKLGDKPPLCDRCHYLVHHSTGKSIIHPTIDALRDTIQESPFKYNHVYHIMDAADFPMSLLPRIHQLLDMMPLRTKNRRSQGGKFFEGRQLEMSFVITRSDLLAPQKDQVDSLMPYIKDVLREALGRSGRNVRLGNVRCVSAKRSWWVKELKEEVWKRGGGGWMVGKVNVGKSQLFEAIFPKGRMDLQPSKHQISVALSSPESKAPGDKHAETHGSVVSDDLTFQKLDESSLLPPAQRETNYPAMPLVSSLPGTTASPIRIPFGNGRGELIDLPGLSRGDMENYLKEECRSQLVMKSRVVPIQKVLKPGQSILLGGFIRITPEIPPEMSDLVFLAYNFTTLDAHVTGTDKAIAIQTQSPDAPGVDTMLLPGAGADIKHAGTFSLTHDVTLRRARSMLRGDKNLDRLPFRILAVDLLIEGCGWVEIVAQVSARKLNAANRTRVEEVDEAPRGLWDVFAPVAKTETVSQASDGPNWPRVSVSSPDGRFIGSRKTLNGWLLNKPKVQQTPGQRPRKSMKGVKKHDKLAQRVAAASGSEGATTQG